MRKDKTFIRQMLAAANKNGYIVEVEQMTGGSYGCLPEDGEPFGSGFSVTFRLHNPHEWNSKQFDAVSKILNDFSSKDHRFSKNMAKEEQAAKDKVKELVEALGLEDISGLRQGDGTVALLDKLIKKGVARPDREKKGAIH